ncbi:50S ribosomal protein L15 [Patescibacteria group bacterium]|nr:50S ribosomal protein L15 [Patescibacteria group bacterium]
MLLSELKKIPGNAKKAKRVGRGIGSGKGGHTTGKGTKGQKSRAGKTISRGFEGGQVPLFKRIPKRAGFTNRGSKQIATISLVKFNLFEDNQKVVPVDLVKIGLLKYLPKDGVKILSNGELHKKITFKGFLVSASALEKIQKAGSTLA